MVLRKYKDAIGWVIDDIKGITPTICMHKILLEENTKPTREPQRRLNPIMQEVVKKEILKLLDAGIIYSIPDSRWVSPLHVVPKKSGVTVVKNDKNEMVAQRLQTGWRVCIDYRKLNAVIKKDHFPLPFIDNVLERLAGHQFYYFLILLFLRWILRIQSDSYRPRGSRENHIHLPIRYLCLSKDALRPL